MHTGGSTGGSENSFIQALISSTSKSAKRLGWAGQVMAPLYDIRIGFNLKFPLLCFCRELMENLCLMPINTLVRASAFSVLRCMLPHMLAAWLAKPMGLSLSSLALQGLKKMWSVGSM
jgi:hypothetical protein